LPEIVQDIGAYAGLASIVGLAVLSVLYFSQARDVKRLREWAGRAPERAEQETAVVQPTPGKAPSQPQAQQPAQAQPQQQPQPAKAPAVPAAAGAAAAATQQKQSAAPKLPAATPAPAAAGATATAKPTAATAQSGAASTALKEGASPPAQPQTAPASGQPAGAQAAPAGAAAGKVAPGQPSGAPAAPAGAAAAKPGAPPVPGAPRPATSAASGGKGGPPPAPAQASPQPAGRPAPQQTEIIPPKRDSWHQRIFGSTRNLILAICGVVLLGAGVALALTQLSSDDGGTPAGNQAAEEPQGGAVNGGGNGDDQGEDRQQQDDRPAIDPSTVTVAVLNGTTVPGLAARVSDEVQSAGFEVGTVANSSDQQRAESVILFAPGHEREAAAVSRRLDISQRERIDAATQGLAGDATVVVVTGADRS
jgi:hypothetical protein